MSLKIGIVGLPNVGKSTLFNALMKRQQALAANYPFATVEPNVGVVAVPDERLENLARVVEANTGVRPPEVPAVLKVIDIAGIVKGAHKGEGLGNQFLSNIREVDLIAHVVRHFDDSDVVRTGENWVEDFETVHSELVLKDWETVEKQLKNAKREIREKPKYEAVLNRLVAGFNQGKWAREIIDSQEQEMVKELFLLTMKPEIVVVNIGEEDLGRAESIRESVLAKLGGESRNIVVVSAKIESELSVLDAEDAAEFLAELGIEESGLERLARSAYEQLGLISFLTAGEKEVRAWTVKRGTKASAAAGVIHSDFEKKFIKVEVVKYGDFVKYGGKRKCGEKGLVRVEGRDYVVQDGDVVEFKVGG